MVSKGTISNNLRALKNLYDNSKSPLESLLYSKMSVLELSGWIEESMDDIIRKVAKRKLKQISNLKHLEQKIIHRTYQFEYDQHFRNMLIRLIGIITTEKLEQKLDKTKFDLMCSELKTLQEARNKEAHTHLRGITRSIDAPSVTMTRFRNVYHGLKNMEDTLKKIKL